MLTHLHQTILGWASWPLVSILVTLMLVISQGFTWRAERLGVQADRRPPDVRFGYTHSELETLFGHWGPDGRRLYVTTQLTLDLLFPLVYGLLFACLIVRTCDPSWGRWLCLLPLILVVCDYVENCSCLGLTWLYRDGNPLPIGLVTIASLATQAKIILFLTTVLVILIAGVITHFRAEKMAVAPPGLQRVV